MSQLKSAGVVGFSNLLWFKTAGISDFLAYNSVLWMYSASVSQL